MTTPVIIDVIMAVVLIAAVIYGAHRGLFRALAGLAVVIVALVGAAITQAAGFVALLLVSASLLGVAWIGCLVAVLQGGKKK